MGNQTIYKQWNALEEIFGIKKPIIATLHLMSLPGSPHYKGEAMTEILRYTMDEVEVLINAGIDGLIIENHGDIPFLKPEKIGHETVAAMTFIASEVKKVADNHNVQIGINCLANAPIPALAIGKAVGAKFIRINQFVNAYVSNEGFMDGKAGEVLRYRKSIGAEDIAIFADVHVKHGSHSIVADRSISEQAKDVLFFCGDVLICTGNRTGDPPNADEISELKVTPETPVLIGSGTTAQNLKQLLTLADGTIIASYFKDHGKWQYKVNQDRVNKFMSEVKEFRKSLS
jgi:membrane complex biogenesis BtpA family protein